MAGSLKPHQLFGMWWTIRIKASLCTVTTAERQAAACMWRGHFSKVQPSGHIAFFASQEASTGGSERAFQCRGLDGSSPTSWTTDRFSCVRCDELFWTTEK
eukprot:gnl/TRDRNA2_/TRDRNA2_131161_c2_seq1.p2 gnl/TRDRNA2_/TRDRNA2_131161_c2~~gnl/TRDRNA2_/TRDRNA2_131161_c2_seq1.p2  ORF type:complete len:101 (+),score=12.87 gnl/TRDRNA2_/TRDRNA2_131161_c2_seq1:365-667(+)